MFRNIRNEMVSLPERQLDNDGFSMSGDDEILITYTVEITAPVEAGMWSNAWDQLADSYLDDLLQHIDADMLQAYLEHKLQGSGFYVSVNEK